MNFKVLLIFALVALVVAVSAQQGGKGGKRPKGGKGGKGPKDSGEGGNTGKGGKGGPKNPKGPKGPKNPKGLIKLKADWRDLDSPKKRTNEIFLFAFLLFTANKTNLFICFLGESTARQNCFQFYLTFRFKGFLDI